MTDYQRVLTQTDLFFAGTGHIIGAGIFVLLAETSKYSGKYTYISTLIAGLLIFYIAQSYIKINKKYDSNDAEYKVLNDAFNKITAKTIIIIAVIGLICGVYLVSSSCGSYTSKIINVKKNLITYAVLFLIMLINIIGVKSVAHLNTLTLGIGMIGLFSIIGYGIKSISKDNKDNNNQKLIKYIQIDNNINENNKKETSGNIIKNVLLGSYIIVFSYFGFEMLIKLNKESINPQKDIPKAMNKSIMFTSILYAMIAFIYGYHKYHKKISNTDTPMTSLISVLDNSNILRQLINLSGVMFTFNTALLMLTNASRLSDGLFNGLFNNKLIKSDKIPTKYILIIGIITIVMNILSVSVKKSTFIANGCILTLLISVVVAQKLKNI